MHGRCRTSEILRPITADRIPILLVIGCCVLPLVLFSSCTGAHPIQREDRPADGQIFSSNYSVIFVIHGDGNYLVHDADGNEYSADEAVLSEAKIIAQLNPKGSTFIFHQRPKRNIFLFFPAENGEFYYYHNGKLAAYEEYWRDQEQSPYDAELELYRRFHGESQSELLSMFLYFGHEIPESGGNGYDASYPDRSFTVNDLAGILKEFTRNTAPFNMVSLATCYGGTPFTVRALAPYAKFIIASPENLHLSYLNFRTLARLDTTALLNGIASFTKIYAEQAFRNLTKSVQTAVSVTVYDVNRVQAYVDTVHAAYSRALNSSGDRKNAVIDHCDCAEIPEFYRETMSDGVDVYYQPARFGRSKNAAKHSGWECFTKREYDSARN